MNEELPVIAALSRTIADLLEARDGADDFRHVYHPSAHGIKRLGFTLEPTPALYTWVREESLDALFVHRPWRLDISALPEHVGVVAYHQPLDATLAVGYNRYLAAALGLRDMTPLGKKADLPLGMIGDIAPLSWDGWEDHVRQEFRGIERVSTPAHATVSRVAVIGAMNDSLVRVACDAGADVYVTGQFRAPGREAVQETGIGVIAVGHARGELWGLRRLAALVGEKYPSLQTVVRNGG